MDGGTKELAQQLLLQYLTAVAKQPQSPCLRSQHVSRAMITAFNYVKYECMVLVNLTPTCNIM